MAYRHAVQICAVKKTRGASMELMKSTWATRHVPSEFLRSWGSVEGPVTGDVLACEVLMPSLHGRVETANGARAKLYPGDRIACVLGNRYATSMLEGAGTVSSDVIHLLSASGVCGEVVERCDKTARPTTLQILAQAYNGQHPLNLRSFASRAGDHTGADPLWVVVVGSAMDSGKTTACASLVHGLRQAGHRVGAAKLTGTTSARDVGSFRDAGADPVLDFSDVGWASTAGCSSRELYDIVTGLADHLRAAEVDVAVLEIADGLLQMETDLLLRELRSWVGPVQVVLAVRESLAGVAGAGMLAALGHHILAVTGVVTSSPLACREVELAGVGPCIPTVTLGSGLAPRIGQLLGPRMNAAGLGRVVA